MLIEVTLNPDDNGTFFATCPALPEVTSFGETEADALVRVRDGIIFALDIRMRKKADLPIFRPPRKGVRTVDLSNRVVMKLALYQAMRGKNWRKADLARELEVMPSEVDRLLSLTHKTGLDQMETALASQGLKAEVKVVPLSKAG